MLTFFFRQKKLFVQAQKRNILWVKITKVSYANLSYVTRVPWRYVNEGFQRLSPENKPTSPDDPWRVSNVKRYVIYSRIKFRGDRDVLSAPQVRKQQYELRSRFACFDVVPMVRVPINPRWLESPTREVTWGDSPSLRYEFHNASWRWGFQEQGGEVGGGSGGFVFCESCSLACDRHTALLLTPS